MTNQVLTEVDSGVLIVRLNRAEKKNALTSEMYTAMADSIDHAEGDRAIKVVLLTGSDGIYTAGNDLGDFLSNPSGDADRPVNRFIAKIVTTDIPLMAAVDGPAVGIGTTMLLHFDQVFATENARFSMPFINLALVPEAGSSLQLVEACGYKKAAELLLLGEPFGAGEALDYGIISRICPADELMEQALGMARKLASKPRDALLATKRLMRRPKEPILQRIQAESDLFFERLTSPAAVEAISAFMEKRSPDFSKFE